MRLINSDYKYDPTHKNKPEGINWRQTKKGWTDIVKKKEVNKSKIFDVDKEETLESRAEEIKIYGGYVEVSNLKSHPLYKNSQNGDIKSARKILSYFSQDFFNNYCSDIGEAEILVPLWDGNIKGNVLPIAFAERVSSFTKSPIQKDIYLDEDADHIHQIEKMLRSAKIKGKIQKDCRYIIVADYEYMGWSIDSLHDYIVQHGGISEKAIILTKSHFVIRKKSEGIILLYPSSSELKKVSDLIEDKIEGSGIELRDLTRPMLVYLINLYKKDQLIDVVREKARDYQLKKAKVETEEK